MVRNAFRARWFDVRLSEHTREGKLQFVVSGEVKKFQRNALKNIRGRDQSYMTGAALNEMCARGLIEQGTYVVHK